MNTMPFAASIVRLMAGRAVAGALPDHRATDEWSVYQQDLKIARGLEAQGKAAGAAKRPLRLGWRRTSS
jgi:hypothetical protein